MFYDRIFLVLYHLLFSFVFRLSSKPHGAMNGDIYNHIDQELEILNSGE